MNKHFIWSCLSCLKYLITIQLFKNIHNNQITTIIMCVERIECIDLFQSMHMHYGHYVDGDDE